MENASKALTMAANLLLAVIILSLIMYFYNELRKIPLEEDLAKVVEQAQEFNKQYEVYDKRIMYGVDVISAINKAISNNEKYVQGSWLSGQLSEKEFAIDIVVVLASPLEENITIRAYNGNDEMEYTSGQGPSDPAYSNLTFADLLGDTPGDIKVSPAFQVPSTEYTNIYVTPKSSWNDSTFRLKTHQIDVRKTVNPKEKELSDRLVYHLLPGGEYSKDAIAEDAVYLKYLVSAISTFTESNGQTVYNKEEVTTPSGEKFIDINNPTGWSSMTWRPAVIDLKNRKFKCAAVDENGKMTGEPGVVYSDLTGAITKLMFIEYELKD